MYSMCMSFCLVCLEATERLWVLLLFLVFLCYPSSLSTLLTPLCPLPHYLSITSSSCGLQVTMATAWFALQTLSTWVHVSLFPLSSPSLALPFWSCWCVSVRLLKKDVMKKRLECLLLFIDLCFLLSGSLSDIHSDTIVHSYFAALLLDYILVKCLHKEGLYLNVLYILKKIALISLSFFALWWCSFVLSIWLCVFYCSCRRSILDVSDKILITSSSPGATKINCFTK